MPKGQLKINNVDAYDTWGISLTDGAMSALMTPPPLKDYVENECMLQHGKRVLIDARYIRKDSRDVSLPIHITAANKEQFIEKYAAFCEDVLAKGVLDIWTSYQPTTVYRMLYVSCRQFQAYMEGIGKFILSLNEPNPDNRGIEPTED